MNRLIVSIGDMKVSNQRDDLLVTYALGSCLALVIYDPVVKVGGMLHAMLADSVVARAIEDKNPFKYVNKGIPLLFKEAYKYGATKKSLKVKMAGCSRLMSENGIFNIGKRNYAAARRILWKNNVIIDKEYCLKSESVTIHLEIGTGKVYIRTGNRTIPL